MATNTHKIVQALAYLAYHQPDNTLDNMKAYKLLWLADRFHLRQTGRTITGDAYYAMPFGIVPSDAKCILENEPTKLRNPKGYAEKYIVSIGNHRFKAIAEPDIKEFSESDQDALDKVIDAYNKYDALQLSDISHSFPEWKFYEELLSDKEAKNSYRVNFDHFFEDAPEGHDALFDDDKALIALTKELYHQYSRNGAAG